MRRDETPLTKVLEVGVVLVVGFLAAQVCTLGPGAAVASAVGLGMFDILFGFARRQPVVQAPSDRDAT